MALAQPLQPAGSLVQQFVMLCKPRVVSLIVFTAVIGMLLALPDMVPLRLLLAATVGISLTAGAAAAINCLVEQKIDAQMARTRARPTVNGTPTPSLASPVSMPEPDAPQLPSPMKFMPVKLAPGARQSPSPGLEAMLPATTEFTNVTSFP